MTHGQGIEFGGNDQYAERILKKMEEEREQRRLLLSGTVGIDHATDDIDESD